MSVDRFEHHSDTFTDIQLLNSMFLRNLQIVTHLVIANIIIWGISILSIGCLYFMELYANFGFHGIKLYLTSYEQHFAEMDF